VPAVQVPVCKGGAAADHGSDLGIRA